jgi:hypothetical protein
LPCWEWPSRCTAVRCRPVPWLHCWLHNRGSGFTVRRRLSLCHGYDLRVNHRSAPPLAWLFRRGCAMPHSGMPSRSIWGLTPRQSIQLACARRGEAGVVSRCVELLAARDVDDELALQSAARQRDRSWTAVSSTGWWCGPWGLAVCVGGHSLAFRAGRLADDSWRIRKWPPK